MKLVIKLCFLVVVSIYQLCSADARSDVSPVDFVPQRISYAELKEPSFFESDGFVEALSTHGIISVIDIPGFGGLKDNTLTWLHACAANGEGHAQKFTYQDGTVRRTMATATVPGPGGMQSISTDDSFVCQQFSKSVVAFRTKVADVTSAFAERLAAELDMKGPLMSTKDGAYSFETVKDVVKEGEHLEHFHSYQRISNAGGSDATIEMHTDQGMFLVFTPGLMVLSSPESERPAEKASTTLAQGFHIERSDGIRAHVKFEPQDELVIMLGDGVNQYINPRLARDPGSIKLRATPHGLLVQPHDHYEARVWYGLMVLPPPGAVDVHHGKTYGEIRNLLVEAVQQGNHKQETQGIGCSSDLRVLQHEDFACSANSTYCWHRCMNHSDYDLSDEVCSSRNLQLQCVNPRGQKYEEGHGDFFLSCSNSTEVATPYPTLPNYPRSENNCTSSMWEEFRSSNGYDHVLDLNVSRFMWNVDSDNQTVDARLAFNGIFGFLAVGLAGPSGMLGASIIMALPGGNYSAAVGLDLSMAPTVQEYVISPTETAFRHWSDPLPARDNFTSDVQSTDCFTAITFQTGMINGIELNLTGTDVLVWAANPVDYFAGYHGPDTRAKFYVNWATGDGSVITEEETTEAEETTDLSTDTSNAAESFCLMAFVGHTLLALIHVLCLHLVW